MIAVRPLKQFGVFSEVGLLFSNEYAFSLLPFWVCDQPLCHELGGPAAALPLLQRESHCCVKGLCLCHDEMWCFTFTRF